MIYQDSNIEEGWAVFLIAGDSFQIDFKYEEILSLAESLHLLYYTDLKRDGFDGIKEELVRMSLEEYIELNGDKFLLTEYANRNINKLKALED